MESRRRIDLCTCGKPRSAHGGLDSMGHNFMPQPQPPALPPPVPHFNTIRAARDSGVWSATVSGPRGIGHGQAAQWTDAVNAAIEDLQEKP